MCMHIKVWEALLLCLLWWWLSPFLLFSPLLLLWASSSFFSPPFSNRKMLGGSVCDWTSRSLMASFKLRSPFSSLLYNIVFSLEYEPTSLSQASAKWLPTQPSASHLSLLPAGAFHDCPSPWDSKQSQILGVRDFPLRPCFVLCKCILKKF